MRLAGIVLLAVLLMATLLLWNRNRTSSQPFLHSSAPTIVDHFQAHPELAAVERPTSRAPAPDPVIEIDPGDYQAEDPTFATSSAELDPELRGIEVAGTLVVPAAWSDVTPQVILCRVGGTDREIVRAQPVRDPSGAKLETTAPRWRALVQGTGRYWIGTVDPAYVMEIEVAGKLDDVRLVLPDPVRMECFVVDARTQKPVVGARLSYRSGPFFTGSRVERVFPDASMPGTYRWRCAAGQGAVWCHARSLGYEDARIDCASSAISSALRIELVTATSIRVCATLIGEVDPKKQALAAEANGGVTLEKDGTLVPLEGTPHFFFRNCVTIKVPRPDTYVVRIAHPPAGYRPSSPRTVVVRENECSEVAFELEPK